MSGGDAQAGFDWPVMLRFAAVSLSIPPHRFWALSLREWRALAAPLAPSSASTAPEPLRRTEFEALFAQHPDTP